MDIKTVTYTTKSAVVPLVALVAIMTSVGFSLMMIVIMLGAGMWISLAALLGSMFVIASLLSGNATYTLNESGLMKQVTPGLRFKTFNNPKTIFYSWAELKGFMAGEDLNRSYQQYEYLRITFRNGDTWQIQSNTDSAGFGIFKQVFIDAAKQYNQAVTPVAKTIEAPHVPALDSVPAAKDIHSKPETTIHREPIMQQKTFYETTNAKVVFWVFLLLQVWLAWWMHTNNVQAGFVIYFRMLFIILPGMIYFFYRLYIKKK